MANDHRQLQFRTGITDEERATQARFARGFLSDLEELVRRIERAHDREALSKLETALGAASRQVLLLRDVCSEPTQQRLRGTG